MAVPYKIYVDCADPHRLAAFWAEAMEYVVEDHSGLIQNLLAAGQVTENDVITVDGRLSWRTAAAVRDPDGPVDARGIGRGGRVLFQVVPEGKPDEPRTGLHFDLMPTLGTRAEEVDRVVGLGATVGSD